MITLRQLLIGVGIAIGLLYLLASLRTPVGRPAPTAPDAATSAAVAPTSTDQGLGERERTEGRVKELAQAKVRLDLRAAAAEQQPAHRQRLLAAHRTEWSALIVKHWSQYQALHLAAGRNPAGETPCTICDDSFLKFCLICDHASDGKCPECHGTGHLLGNEICPACSATGKCFMCAGTGKMPCPFCDQRGMIYYKSPAPSFVPVPL